MVAVGGLRRQNAFLSRTLTLPFFYYSLPMFFYPPFTSFSSFCSFSNPSRVSEKEGYKLPNGVWVEAPATSDFAEFSVLECDHYYYQSWTLQHSLCPVSKKTCHPTFIHNFDECRAISKILSLPNSARKFQHCWYSISHRTLNMCSPTLQNSKNSKILVYLTQQHQFTSNFHKIYKSTVGGWYGTN